MELCFSEFLPRRRGRDPQGSAKRNNGDDFWGNIELAAFATTLLVMAIIVPTNPVHLLTGGSSCISSRSGISAIALVT